MKKNKCLGMGCPLVQWPACDEDIPCCKCEFKKTEDCNSYQPCPAEGSEG